MKILDGIKAGIRALFRARGVILMYHQVCERGVDPWELAVHPDHFNAHLAFLRKHYDVVPVNELADAMQRRSGKRLVAITFDDGFRDNYSHAAPMLDWHDLPATFYFSTTHLSEDHVYWWDVLQAVVLERETLPECLDIEVAGFKMKFRFCSDQFLTAKLAHEIRAWSYSLPVPNERVALFLQLWHLIRPLPYADQQRVMDVIREWASYTDRPCMGEVMTVRELQMLGQNPLFSIGAHTVHHAMLGESTPAHQAFEIYASKHMLEQWLGRPVTAFAYPYGNYTPVTRDLIREAGYAHAVSTEPRAVTVTDDRFSLPRMQVGNWCVHEFASRLNELMDG